jgi:hypothetical protein|tara:strand:- start:15 stop:494 length:480 start_codon:yes stop_codon:yes gene_type:complete
MKHVDIFDKLVSKQQIEEIYNFCKNQSYKRIEDDGPGTPLTGLTSNLELDNDLVKFLLKVTNTSKEKLSRAYINLFIHDEKPYYHQDNPEPGGRTLIYYVNPQPKYFNDLGETFFIIDDEIYGVLPVPGRIIIFDSEVWHKATPLRDDDRYTVALKWSN